MRIEFNQLMKAYQLSKAHPVMSRALLQLAHHYLGLRSDVDELLAKAMKDTTASTADTSAAMHTIAAAGRVLQLAREQLRQGPPVLLEAVQPADDQAADDQAADDQADSTQE